MKKSMRVKLVCDPGIRLDISDSPESILLDHERDIRRYERQGINNQQSWIAGT